MGRKPKIIETTNEDIKKEVAVKFVKVKALRNIISDYGNFEMNEIKDIKKENADKLIKMELVELC